MWHPLRESPAHSLPCWRTSEAIGGALLWIFPHVAFVAALLCNSVLYKLHPISGQRLCMCLPSVISPKYFPKVRACPNRQSCQQCAQGTDSPITPRPQCPLALHVLFVHFLSFGPSGEWVVLFRFYFNSHLPDSTEVAHFRRCLLANWRASLSVCSNFLPIFHFSCLSSFLVDLYESPVDSAYSKDPLSPLACSPTHVTGSREQRNCLILTPSNSSIVSILANAVCVLVKQSLPKPCR